MTSDLQRNALALLGEIWSLSPDVRLGQLLSHFGFLGEVHVGRSLGYIDDDELIAVMQRHRDELLSRQQPGTNVGPTGPAISVSGSPTAPAA